MQGKEFTINRKSAVKKDKAIREIARLEELITELSEKKKSILSLERTVKEKLARYQKILKDNT